MDMLNSEKFLPIKENIYTMIDKIIAYEDQIKEIETNPLYLASISDLAKNKESIALLTQFIKNESVIASNNCSKKTTEASSLKSQLVLLEMSLEKEMAVYTQRDLDQELIKQKCFEKTIELHNSELISYVENAQLLKEEKLTIEYDIVNQMSLKESYEELIKANSQLMFKNLIISYDNSITTSTANLVSLSHSIDVEHYEMHYASISKIVTIVYDILVEYISSLQSFDKSILVSIISNSYGKYLVDQSFDFFSDVTLELIHSNPKFNDFIIPEIFRKLMMLSIKSSALDKIISNKIDFISNVYKPRKNELVKAINNTQEKIDKIRYKLNEVSIEVDKRRVYLNSTRAKEELSHNIKEIEQEVAYINTETKRNIMNYENQIKDLEKINTLLEKKYSAEKNKMTVNQLKKKIDEVFHQIKNTIKTSEHSGEVLDGFINDLNRTTKKKRKNNSTNHTKENQPMQQTLKLIKNENMKDNDLILLSDNDFDIEEEEDIKDRNEPEAINKTNNGEFNNNLNASEEATPLDIGNTVIKNNSHSASKNDMTIQNKSFRNNQSALLNESTIQTPPKPSTIQSSSSSSSSQFKKVVTKTQEQQQQQQPIPNLNPKLSNLYLVTDCYSFLQELNDNSNQFNPLTSLDLIPEEHCYTKSEIYLSKDSLYITIKLQNRELKKISISLLDKTIVTGSMKKVLTIVQLSSHSNSIEEILHSPQVKELHLTEEEIIKLANPKYYHITIILTISKKINLLFLEYNTFKQWVNGFAFIIKSKDALLANNI